MLSNAWSTVVAREGAAVDWRELALTDQTGAVFNLDQFAPQPVVLSFVFTGCTLYCPTQVRALAVMQQKLNERLGEDSYHLVSVTLTPELDSSQSLEAFGQRFGADFVNWRFAETRREDLDRLLSATGTQVVRREVPENLDHTTNVFLLDADGGLQAYDGIPLDHQGLTFALHKRVQKRGQ